MPALQRRRGPRDTAQRPVQLPAEARGTDTGPSADYVGAPAAILGRGWVGERGERGEGGECGGWGCRRTSARQGPLPAASDLRRVAGGRLRHAGAQVPSRARERASAQRTLLPPPSSVGPALEPKQPGPAPPRPAPPQSYVCPAPATCDCSTATQRAAVPRLPQTQQGAEGGCCSPKRHTSRHRVRQPDSRPARPPTAALQAAGCKLQGVPWCDRPWGTRDAGRGDVPQAWSRSGAAARQPRQPASQIGGQRLPTRRDASAIGDR